MTTTAPVLSTTASILSETAATTNGNNVENEAILRDETGAWSTRHVWFPSAPDCSGAGCSSASIIRSSDNQQHSNCSHSKTNSTKTTPAFQPFDFMAVPEKQTIVFPKSLYPDRAAEGALIRDLKAAFWHAGSYTTNNSKTSNNTIGVELSTQERTGQTKGRTATLRLRLRCANHTKRRGKCPFQLTIFWHVQKEHWCYTAPPRNKARLKHAATCAPCVVVMVDDPTTQYAALPAAPTLLSPSAPFLATPPCLQEKITFSKDTKYKDCNPAQRLATTTTTHKTAAAAAQSTNRFAAAAAGGGSSLPFSSSAVAKSTMTRKKSAPTPTRKKPPCAKQPPDGFAFQEKSDCDSASRRITLALAVQQNRKAAAARASHHDPQHLPEQPEPQPCIATTSQKTATVLQSSIDLTARIFSDDLSQCLDENDDHEIQHALLGDAQLNSTTLFSNDALFFSDPPPPLVTTDCLLEEACATRSLLELNNNPGSSFAESHQQQQSVAVAGGSQAPDPQQEPERKGFKRSRSNISSEDEVDVQHQDSSNSCVVAPPDSLPRISTTPPPSDMISWDLEFPFSAPSA